jgi:predicted rRNA pseudouridine synthase
MKAVRSLPDSPEDLTPQPDKTPSGLGSGIIIIDKPRGPSSHQVTAWVRDMLQISAGHSGTLDPAVSGVLAVMIGNAVRLAPILLNQEKEYVCLMRLHQDVTGERLEEILAEFQGRIYQRPPRKSAVARRLRIRTIMELELLDLQGRLVLLRVRCDAGTYIRSLCHHIGLALGTGAHMQELRRTRSGPFAETAAHSLQDLKDALIRAKAGEPESLAGFVLPIESATADLPRVVITDAAIDALCHGAGLAGVGVTGASPFQKKDIVAVYSKKEELICLGEAIVPSTSFRPGDHGLVIAPRAVFMAPGTYPRGWKKQRPDKSRNQV